MKHLIIALLALVFVSKANAFMLSKDEQFILKQINQYRKEYNLKPVKADEKTAKYAWQRVKEIQSDWSHKGFLNGVPYSPAIENLSKYYPKEKVVNAWQESPTHNENLLRKDINRMGIKINNDYIALEGRKATFYEPLFETLAKLLK